MEPLKSEERPLVQPILEPFQRFIHAQSSGGVLLLAATAAAMLWANSPWAESYIAFWHTPVGLVVGSYPLTQSLLEWINDGLMAMFFFVIGLEIKREILAGELASLRQAAFPLAAALGGTIVPASLYTAINIGGPGARGWGIPMATDIAFALGILSLLGKRVPLSLRIFLSALAIADDLMAVVVIALFYTSEISWLHLGIGAFFLLMLVGANAIGIRQPLVYSVLGIGGLWPAFLLSGVHATVAGVLAAMTIPARTRLDRGRALLRFEEVTELDKPPPADPQRHVVTRRSEGVVKHVDTPLQRLEHALHPWVSFVIIPIFALANAGVAVGSNPGALIASPVAIGVLTGLVVGKPVGIVLASWLSVRTGLAKLPHGVKWSHMIGVGFVAGIGFTMSLFITGLAFPQGEASMSAKVGILLASTVAGFIGWVILRRIHSMPPDFSAPGRTLLHRGGPKL